jgi:hypothetical protein
MTPRLWPLLITCGIVTACTPIVRGPDATLQTIATPDPVTPEVRVTTITMPGPTPGTGQWRAWMPAQTQPNGETTEGHWVTLSLEAPTLTVIEPVKPIPRAPKPVMTPKQPVIRRPAAQAPAPAIPQVTPVLPSGLTGPQGGQ